MFRFQGKSKDKQKIVDEKVEEFNRPLENSAISTSLGQNIAKIKELFKDIDILRLRPLHSNEEPRQQYCIVFLEGMINAALINDFIVKPLQLYAADRNEGNIMAHLTAEVIQINETCRTQNFHDIIHMVSYGDTVLFIDGCDEALVLNTRCHEGRAISEPDNEKSLLGPREGFAEGLLQNLSLIRRKIRTHDLKMKMTTLGRRTKTDICICYMEGLVDKDILNELYHRLDKIDIDGVLDSNYITEFIRDSPRSPFRTIGYTEKPDITVAKLLEGRIAILVDGSPVAITLPYLFIESFQSSEDYYLSYYYGSFSRTLRIVGFFMSILVPGTYIAIVAFHHEMLPTPLLMNIAAARQSVPLPAALEAFVMLLVFDLLRETGIRMPSNIGHALSIVGALVIGQSAVEAKLVAAPMIIIVAITGITSLLVPKLNAPVVYLRFIFLLAGAMFGFYGVLLALCILMIHLLSLKSFGVDVLSFSGSFEKANIQDKAVRFPWHKLRLRPNQITTNHIRIGTVAENDSYGEGKEDEKNK